MSYTLTFRTRLFAAISGCPAGTPNSSAIVTVFQVRVCALLAIIGGAWWRGCVGAPAGTVFLTLTAD